MKRIICCLLIVFLLVGCSSNGNNDKSSGESGSSDKEITVSLDFEQLDKWNHLDAMSEKERKEYAIALRDAIVDVETGKDWGAMWNANVVHEEELSSQYGNYGTSFYRILVEKEDECNYVEEDWDVTQSEIYYRRWYAENETGDFWIVYSLHSSGVDSEDTIIGITNATDKNNRRQSLYKYNLQGEPTSFAVTVSGSDNKVRESENYNWK